MNVACSNTSQALTSKNSQELTEEICVTSLTNRPQLQDEPSIPTSTHPDFSESKATLSSLGERPKPCGLLTIAGELRDIIYSHLIASGQVEILRLSQQLHDEAKETLYKKGIFRVSLCTQKRIYQPEVLRPMTMPSHSKVQNFNIIMSFELLGCNREHIPMNGFDKLDLGFLLSVQGSGDCHITLAFGVIPHHPPYDDFLHFMQLLGTFKLVTLRIHTNHRLHPMDRRNQLVLKPRLTLVLQSIAASSSPALGYAEWKPDTCSSARYQMSSYVKAEHYGSPFPNAQYLEFHPREKREITNGLDS